MHRLTFKVEMLRMGRKYRAKVFGPAITHEYALEGAGETPMIALSKAFWHTAEYFKWRGEAQARHREKRRRLRG